MLYLGTEKDERLIGTGIDVGHLGHRPALLDVIQLFDTDDVYPQQ